MKIEELATPAILLDMEKAKGNIRKYQTLADQYHKEIWPMMKTHKSTELALLQKELGASGALCGTLDEAEALCDAGISNIMYAYPVSTVQSIDRVTSLSKRCNFILRIDCLDAAALLDKAASEVGITISCSIIIDSGLHRFGVTPEDAGKFAKELSTYPSLKFVGISTHPGHVYEASCAEDLPRYSRDEQECISRALESLKKEGFTPEIVTSGSTPTFRDAVSDENIQIYHPGNYIFHDMIQISTDTCSEDECALTVLASVISHPRDGLYIIDAGAKCLGLDQGAHGNGSITGFGRILGHPELTIFSLSEEVGKIHVEGETTLRVGDKIQIIPNHSCSSANLTSYYVTTDGKQVTGTIPVDIRENSTQKI